MKRHWKCGQKGDIRGVYLSSPGNLERRSGWHARCRCGVPYAGSGDTVERAVSTPLSQPQSPVYTRGALTRTIQSTTLQVVLEATRKQQSLKRSYSAEAKKHACQNQYTTLWLRMTIRRHQRIAGALRYVVQLPRALPSAVGGGDRPSSSCWPHGAEGNDGRHPYRNQWYVTLCRQKSSWIGRIRAISLQIVTN